MSLNDDCVVGFLDCVVVDESVFRIRETCCGFCMCVSYSFGFSLRLYSLLGRRNRDLNTVTIAELLRL